VAKRAVELVGVVDADHAASAPAGGGLEQDRVADLGGDGERCIGRLRRVRTGPGGHPGGAGDAPRLDLVAAAPDRVGRRSDEHQAVRRARLGEGGALGQEAVPGVDRVALGEQCAGDDLLDAQIALGGARRPDVDHVVGQPCGERVLVGLADGDDRADPFVAAGTHDPHGDLAAVGDQHPAQTAGDPIRIRTWFRPGPSVRSRTAADPSRPPRR
jgi:hypothetical protein